MFYGKDYGDLLPIYKKSKNMFVQSIKYLKAEQNNKRKLVFLVRILLSLL